MGLPLVGETWAFLRDPYTFLEERQRRYGDVFRSAVLGRRVVFLAGVGGAETFYDPDLISRSDAHPYTLRAMFGAPNMEMFDGPRHLALKTIAGTAFGDEAIEAYLPDMYALIEARWAELVAGGRRVAAIPRLKHLAIEAIWTSVMGRPERAEMDEVTHDYEAVVAGMTSIPIPLPGTAFRRAIDARDRLLDRIRREIATRRERPTADGLTRMLTATAPPAAPMTDREALLEVHHVVVAGFIVYLLMAEVLRRLADDPALLDRCDAEIARHVPEGAPTGDALARLATCRSVVDEAKRFVPIVPLAFGRARRRFRCGGFDVPAGWTVYLALHLINHDPRIFDEPLRFDPDRFGPDRAEHRRHAMAFIPQGAEPATGHRCLGVDYSTAIVLVFMAVLLRGYRWTLPPQDLGLDRRLVPPEPRDRLRVDVRPRASGVT